MKGRGQEGAGGGYGWWGVGSSKIHFKHSCIFNRLDAKTSHSSIIPICTESLSLSEAICSNSATVHLFGRPNSVVLVFSNQNGIQSQKTRSFPQPHTLSTHLPLRVLHSFTASLCTQQHSSPLCCHLCFVTGVNGWCVGEASYPAESLNSQQSSHLPLPTSLWQRCTSEVAKWLYSFFFLKLLRHSALEEKYQLTSATQAHLHISLLLLWKLF